MIDTWRDRHASDWQWSRACTRSKATNIYLPLAGSVYNRTQTDDFQPSIIALITDGDWF